MKNVHNTKYNEEFYIKQYCGQHKSCIKYYYYAHRVQLNYNVRPNLRHLVKMNGYTGGIKNPRILTRRGIMEFIGSKIFANVVIRLEEL